MKPLASRLEDLRASAASSVPSQPVKSSVTRALHVVACACAVSIILLGVTVFVAWLRNYQPAIAVLPGHVGMKANTAIVFICANLSLLLILTAPRATRIWIRVLAATVIAFALLTIAEYLLHVNLRIDQLLVADSGDNPFPGRMAPITAINFLIAGISILLLTGSRLQRWLAHALGLLLAAVSITSIVGFLYGVSTLYGSGKYTAMALHTGISFLVLATSLLLAAPETITTRMIAAPGVSGWLVRRALPAVIILPILVGWLYLKGPLEMTSLRFGMAIFSVSLAAASVAGLWLVFLFLSRAERQRAEIDHIREEAAAVVRQSEQELRIVTDQLPTLISYIDPEGRYLRVNQTYQRWTGLPPEAIIGKTIVELFGPAYWLAIAPERNRALAGETVTFDSVYPTLIGAPAAPPRRVQITYAPDIAPEGEVRGLVCMVLDVEEQRRAEAAIRQSEKLAVVGRLASSIAHEINNPLEAVTNLLYLTEQDSAPGSPTRGYIQLAQQELARVTHIVTQTLRFHRQSHLPVHCHIADMAEQVLSLYQGRLAQAHIEIRRRFRCADPILCRDGEIRQVLANLIGNSAEAMAANSTGDNPHPRHLHLRTRSALCPRTGLRGIRVTVADTGHGISPETRKTLFQPFHTTKGATGSGLGLWVSKEIIDRHAGKVSVRSSTHTTRHHTVFAIFLAHQEQIPTS